MIKIFDDAEQLFEFAAEKFVEIAEESIQARGRLTVALAGGSTPKSLHQLLAGDDYRNKVDWNKVFFFFGDERNVPPADDESNFRMANESLFKPLAIAERNIFRWRTELETSAAIAADYELQIVNFFALTDDEFPRFDLILLGMGGDGHTASLFPATSALDETVKIAVDNLVEKLEATRLTLTFPVINAARQVIFLVKGADKAAVLKKVLEGAAAPPPLPAQNVKPASGELFWLVDTAAAALLNR